MTEQQSLQSISMMLSTDAEAALRQIEVHRGSFGESAEAYELEGKAHLKRSDWRKAQNAFLKSNGLRPDGPARQYLDMLADIMAFYNKDMYNQ